MRASGLHEKGLFCRPARAWLPRPVQGERQQILACAGDGLLVYSTLKKMRFLQPGQLSADELAQQAAALYQARTSPCAGSAGLHGARAWGASRARAWRRECPSMALRARACAG